MKNVSYNLIIHSFKLDKQLKRMLAEKRASFFNKNHSITLLKTGKNIPDFFLEIISISVI